MKKLSTNWIIDKIIDFEYKKYILLSYFKSVYNFFRQNKIYPVLDDLTFHYKEIKNLKNNLHNYQDLFPSTLTKIDLENLKFIYKKNVKEDNVMKELYNIIEFAEPRFKKAINEGKEIYEIVENNISIYPVGIVPVKKDEGYLFLRNLKKKKVILYEYKISIFDNPEGKYPKINTNYITSITENFSNTPEKIKLRIIKYHKKFPNPATFSVESKLALPVKETFLPIARNLLCKYIFTNFDINV